MKSFVIASTLTSNGEPCVKRSFASALSVAGVSPSTPWVKKASIASLSSCLMFRSAAMPAGKT